MSISLKNRGGGGGDEGVVEWGGEGGGVVGGNWLLNVPATSLCILGTDLLWKLCVPPH